MSREPRLGGAIRVRVKLVGYLSQFSQPPYVDLECAVGDSLSKLIARLMDQMGASFRQVTLDPFGNLHGGLEVILDGELQPARELSTIILEKDSEVLLMPMISGGAGSLQKNQMEAQSV
ncbi:MAG: hypothetical protein Q8N45_01975 [Anaerolineales bacterium]|nr:hypothetical protein [Anaerolineales bacterium]MDP2974959.1 hypothetical protein [Anaerolineales bacterium]MDP3185244.1 hypothetical protein [Anaerolineales bacterium]